MLCGFRMVTRVTRVAGAANARVVPPSVAPCYLSMGREDEFPSEEPKPAGPRQGKVWRYRPGWPRDLASTGQALQCLPLAF